MPRYFPPAEMDFATSVFSKSALICSATGPTHKSSHKLADKLRLYEFGDEPFKDSLLQILRALLSKCPSPLPYRRL